MLQRARAFFNSNSGSGLTTLAGWLALEQYIEAIEHCAPKVGQVAMVEALWVRLWGRFVALPCPTTRV
jgi:hypothetical protein